MNPPSFEPYDYALSWAGEPAPCYRDPGSHSMIFRSRARRIVDLWRDGPRTLVALRDLLEPHYEREWASEILDFILLPYAHDAAHAALLLHDYFQELWCYDVVDYWYQYPSPPTPPNPAPPTRSHLRAVPS